MEETLTGNPKPSGNISDYNSIEEKEEMCKDMAGYNESLTVNYQQDKIKTILQSSIDDTNYTKKVQIKTIINNIYKSGGIKQFYSGFTWALYRATLLHSGTFLMMEYLTNTYYTN